ncbi:MAG: glycerophosphodiester phosphodiesterase [Vicinamibacterales bacterium]
MVGLAGDKRCGREKVAVFGHRGASRARPENTISAFDRAVEAGADGLELDLRLSLDGVPMVHHDATLERTTGGKGRVDKLTASELARLDAGFNFSPETGYPFRGRGTGIPSLREVLERYRGVPLILELKGSDSALAARSLEEVRRAGALDNVVFGSFSHAALRAVRRMEPSAATGASLRELRFALALCRLPPAARLASLLSRLWRRKPAYRAIQVPWRFHGRRVVTAAFVRHVRERGLPVQVWTVNEPALARTLVSWGVTGLITDVPEVMAGLRCEGTEA